MIALADTGASCSCISMAFLTQRYEGFMRCGGRLVKGSTIRLTGADTEEESLQLLFFCKG